MPLYARIALTNEAPSVGTFSDSRMNASSDCASWPAVTCDSVKATGLPRTRPNVVTGPCTERMARSVYVCGGEGFPAPVGVVTVWSRISKGTHWPLRTYDVEAND